MPRSHLTQQTGLARAFMWGAAFTLTVVICYIALAEAQVLRERDLTEELSRAKAERLARTIQLRSEPTANQSDFNVLYYDLDLEMIPTTSTVAGSVTMDAAVLAASIATVELDLDSAMTVSQTWSGGLAVSHTHTTNLLTITLDRTYTLGEVVTVRIDYSGTPDPSYGTFAFDTDDGVPVIWSLSQPFGARSWWPCKDDPSDKADSVDVRVTVPDTLIVASNGNLIAETPVGSGKKRYHWHESYPIATYLVSVAIHPYAVYSDWYHYSPTDSMEVRFYVKPFHLPFLQPVFAATVPILEAFAGIFGEYPFLNEKYGHAWFLGGGAMEHQTIMSYTSWSVGLIAHEVAHQWYGDYVTCENFHHIWMNEGFATYAEALWAEHVNGEPAYFNMMQVKKYTGAGTVYVPNTSNPFRIFNQGLSYKKASWVLHMLRHVVGDVTFFDILTTYYGDPNHQYGTVTTEEFRDLCEGVSGTDLDWFFHQWIYEEFFPQYAYSWWTYENAGQWELVLDVEQEQTNYIFTMPVDVTIDFASGDTTLVVWDSLAVQRFNFILDEEPVGVQLDKNEWILRSVQEVVTAVGGETPRAEFTLGQNYPNPFNPATTINFSVANEGFVSLRIYDTSGRLVKSLVARHLPAGPQTFAWDGTNRNGRPVASGVYFYELRSGADVATNKMVVLR